MNVATGSVGSARGLPDHGQLALATDSRTDLIDADALRLIATGDGEALRGVFERHWDVVARAAFRIVGNEDDARDSAQEAFIRLHRKPPETGTPLKAWLCRVAINQAVNQQRSGRRRVDRESRHLLGAGEAVTDAISEANRRAEGALVRESLLGLPERMRDLLVLRAEGFRYHEIAASIGVAPGSVGTLLARAEQAFRESYEARRGGA